MKKILILVDKIGPKKELFVKEIADRLNGIADVTLANISGLYFIVDGKNISVEIAQTPIKSFDLVYIRRTGDRFSVLASTLAIVLKAQGVKFIDKSWSEIGPMGSKFTSIVKLALAGLPTIKTVYTWQTEIKKNKNRIIKDLGLPMLAKELSMQRGRGVFKIEKSDDFEILPKVDKSGGDNQFMFQKYIEIKDEFRILVLGEKVGVWERKIVTTSGEFRHNVSLGAKEEFLDLQKIPTDLESLAVNATHTINLQIAGVDICETESGKYNLIEVNRGPGLTYDTKVSPEFDKIAEYFKIETQNE